MPPKMQLTLIAPKLTNFNSVRNLKMDKLSNIEFGGEKL